MTQPPYTDARDFLVRRAASTPVPKVEPGSTSFFSKPTDDMDPRLFSPGSDHLLPSVRSWILNTVSQFWSQRYNHHTLWSTVWIAGSGITHQWSASRGGIGDLDTLIGVDFTRFREHNSRFANQDDNTLAKMLNDEFKSELDLLTANWNGFEVTFYVNPGAANIRDINPYAAYDVTHDRWTVHPISIPSDWDPKQFFPQDWWRAIGDETDVAMGILAEYRKIRALLRSTKDVARRRNTATVLDDIVRRGAALFNDIHLARRNAFSHDGKGYLDWYNFRWQAHKQSGVVPALHALATLSSEAQNDHETALYGSVLTDSAAALAASSLSGSVLDRLEAQR